MIKDSPVLKKRSANSWLTTKTSWTKKN